MYAESNDSVIINDFHRYNFVKMNYYLVIRFARDKVAQDPVILIFLDTWIFMYINYKTIGKVSIRSPRLASSRYD